MTKRTTSNVAVRKNRKGRGLYARRRFFKGEIVTEDHVIVFPHSDARLKGVVHRYTFEWDDDTSALAMGVGSFINHSYQPNVRYKSVRNKQTIQFIALRSVRVGEELVMNYNYEPKDRGPVGFRVKRSENRFASLPKAMRNAIRAARGGCRDANRALPKLRRPY